MPNYSTINVEKYTSNGIFFKHLITPIRVHWLATFAKEEILRIVRKEILCKEFDAKNAKTFLCKLMLGIIYLSSFIKSI